MFGASMPVASVDKYGHFCRPENHICRTPEVGQWARANPVAKTAGMHKAPDQSLGCGVAVSDRLHIPTASGRRGP